MAYNVDLMLEIRNAIKMNPELHKQASWRWETECGTAYCIAGWACHLSGVELEWGETPLASIPETAAELMGIALHEANDLFYTMTEPEALKKLDKLIEKGKNAA